MMWINRREMLRQSAHVVGTAGAMGLGMLAVHRLARPHVPHYPVKPGACQDGALRLIRPPGAIQDDDQFLASCIRCYRCQDACEPGAIQFFGERVDGQFHSPYIDPSVRGCTLCMLCTKACPTDALAPLEIERKREVEMATVELREDICLSYKAQRIRNEQSMMMELGRLPTESTEMAERRGPCGECYMVCPLRERAITLEPGGFLAPVVHKEHCAGCGMCEEICRVMVGGEPAIRVVATRGMVSRS